MKKERNGKLSVDGVLALVLFGIFALCVLAVLLQGAKIYRQLTERGQQSYQQRTAAQYLVTRVRQADAVSAVSVGSLGTVETLELTETIDGTRYVTRVYCWDGQIRELFSAADRRFAPEDGQCILPAQGLDLELNDGLLTAEIVDEDGQSVQISVSLRSGQEVADEE